MHALFRRFGIAALAMSLIYRPDPAYAIADPLEPFNRAMFAFNTAVVNYVIAPVGSMAEVYLPVGVRRAAGRFYANLSEPEFIATNLLAGNFGDARISMQRLVVNTTIGIGGLFDPATGYGWVSRQPEFTEAVCKLGIPPGAYLVLPLVGATNVNSTVVLSSLWVGHLYVLALVSNWLMTAELMVDVVVAAALLRHAADPTDPVSSDPYHVKRHEYAVYVASGCSPHLTVRPAG